MDKCVDLWGMGCIHVHICSQGSITRRGTGRSRAGRWQMCNLQYAICDAGYAFENNAQCQFLRYFNLIMNIGKECVFKCVCVCVLVCEGEGEAEVCAAGPGHLSSWRTGSVCGFRFLPSFPSAIIIRVLRVGFSISFRILHHYHEDSYVLCRYKKAFVSSLNCS